MSDRRPPSLTQDRDAQRAISGNAASLKFSTLSLWANAAVEVSHIDISPSAPPLARSLCEGLVRSLVSLLSSLALGEGSSRGIPYGKFLTCSSVCQQPV
jgi:hypothetical protein